MGNTKRKMPHSNDLKTNGKLDMKKFMEHAPAAREAQASGETRLHKITIEDVNGRLQVRAMRTHKHSKEGIDPRVVVALQDLLMKMAADKVIQITDVNEGSAGGDHDELVIQGA